MKNYYFIGGFYEDFSRNISGEYFGDIFREPCMYTLEKVMKVDFVEPCIDYFNERNNLCLYDCTIWETLSDEVKVGWIMAFMKECSAYDLILTDSLDTALKILAEETKRYNTTKTDFYGLEEEYDEEYDEEYEYTKCDFFEQIEAFKARITK